MSPICSKPLTAGDVIFTSKPLFHCVYNICKTIFCDNCLKRSDRLKKCSKCRQMFYCDKRCQRMDWKYHKLECSLFAHKNYKPVESLWKERLCLRLWLCIQSDQSFATKTYQLFDGSDVCLNDIEVDVKSLSEDIDRMVEFQLICNHFKAYGLDFDRKQLLRWFGLMASNPSVLTLLVHDLMDTSDEWGDKYEQTIGCIGKAFYMSTTSLSHSCLPNSALVLNGHSLQLRAMSCIGIGEQITISYIPLDMNREDRQKALKQLFLLECQCHKCELSLDAHIDYSICDHFLGFQLIDQPLDPHLEYYIRMKKILLDLQVYQSYHPNLSLSYSVHLSFVHNNLNDPQKTRECTDTTLKHIRATHGVDHPFYRIIAFLSTYFFKL